MLAAQPAATAAAVHQFAIPSGTLSDALARLAATAGMQLVFDPAVQAGLRSEGLQGRYEVREGFARLLRGSGFEAVAQSGGGYALRRQAAVANPAPVRTQGSLPAVTVTAPSGYAQAVKVDQASVTRSGASILDTPQTISVVPAQTAQDQAAQTIGDVVRNTASARPRATSGPTSRCMRAASG